MSQGPDAARGAGTLPPLQLRVRLLWIRHGLSCANVLNACSVKEDNVAEARTAKSLPFLFASFCHISYYCNIMSYLIYIIHHIISHVISYLISHIWRRPPSSSAINKCSSHCRHWCLSWIKLCTLAVAKSDFSQMPLVKSKWLLYPSVLLEFLVGSSWIKLVKLMKLDEADGISIFKCSQSNVVHSSWSFYLRQRLWLGCRADREWWVCIVFQPMDVVWQIPKENS